MGLLDSSKKVWKQGNCAFATTYICVLQGEKHPQSISVTNVGQEGHHQAHFLFIYRCNDFDTSLPPILIWIKCRWSFLQVALPDWAKAIFLFNASVVGGKDASFGALVRLFATVIYWHFDRNILIWMIVAACWMASTSDTCMFPRYPSKEDEFSVYLSTFNTTPFPIS